MKRRLAGIRSGCPLPEVGLNEPFSGVKGKTDPTTKRPTRPKVPYLEERSVVPVGFDRFDREDPRGWDTDRRRVWKHLKQVRRLLEDASGDGKIDR